MADDFERLSYENRFVRNLAQTVEGAECFAPFVALETENNLLTGTFSEAEITEMLSAIITGAEITYPEKSHQVYANFLKMIHCPPELDPEAGCVKYSPTASFVHYSPNHPDSDIVPAGYLWSSWMRFGRLDTIFPNWLDDWLQGLIEDFTGYNANDVLCNIASFPINSVEAFLANGGIFPSFEIHVSGTGTIEIEFLSFPLGGRACVKLDSAPNIADLFGLSILDPNTLYVDTNRDLLSFPPEENVSSTIKVDVETVGDHILYVVFVPIVDDSLAFIGLGGGIRSVELCGFEEIAEVGIEAIVWADCALSYTIDGVPTQIVTAEEIQACLDFTGVGGSGSSRNGLALDLMGSYFNAAAIQTNSTTYVDADVNLDQDFTMTESGNVVSAWYIPQATKGTSGTGTFRLVLDGVSGSQEVDVAQVGSAQGIWVLGHWIDVAEGNHTITLQFKSSSAANVVISADHETTWRVQVFSPVESTFLQDVRIEAGELQKKIGGVWYDVVTSFADIIADLQTAINAAQSTANTAITTANNAETVAIAANNKAQFAVDTNETQDMQIGVLQTNDAFQDSRLDALEECCDTVEASIAGLQAQIDAINTELGSLSDEVAGLGIWSEQFVFVSGMQGWNSTGEWNSGVGFIVGSGNEVLNYPFTTIQGGIVEKLLIKVQSITSGDMILQVEMNGDNPTPLQLPVNASSLNNIHQVIGAPAEYTISILMPGTGIFGGGDYAVVAIVVMGSGENPF